MPRRFPRFHEADEIMRTYTIVPRSYQFVRDVMRHADMMSAASRQSVAAVAHALFAVVGAIEDIETDRDLASLDLLRECKELLRRSWTYAAVGVRHAGRGSVSVALDTEAQDGLDSILEYDPLSQGPADSARATHLASQGNRMLNGLSLSGALRMST